MRRSGLNPGDRRHSRQVLQVAAQFYVSSRDPSGQIVRVGGVSNCEPPAIDAAAKHWKSW